MAKKRACETVVETVLRQELNQTCMAKKRASETAVETAQRQKQNRAYMSKKRALSVPIEKCITDFKSKVKQGPEFVCTCCHRMMYWQSVVLYLKYASSTLENKKMHLKNHNTIMITTLNWSPHTNCTILVCMLSPQECKYYFLYSVCI